MVQQKMIFHAKFILDPKTLESRGPHWHLRSSITNVTETYRRNVHGSSVHPNSWFLLLLFASWLLMISNPAFIQSTWRKVIICNFHWQHCENHFDINYPSRIIVQKHRNHVWFLLQTNFTASVTLVVSWAPWSQVAIMLSRLFFYNINLHPVDWIVIHVLIFRTLY